MISFYGGKPGHSVKIAKVYGSYEDLKTGFTNDEVKYGEYALISCSNKFNIEHGSLYYKDYNQELPSPRGNISGPRGAAIEADYVFYDEALKDDISEETHRKVVAYLNQYPDRFNQYNIVAYGKTDFSKTFYGKMSYTESGQIKTGWCYIGGFESNIFITTDGGGELDLNKIKENIGDSGICFILG